jgi:hypothetical protein
LAAHGYTNVREYVAGKKDWKEAGYLVERSNRDNAADIDRSVR